MDWVCSFPFCWNGKLSMHFINSSRLIFPTEEHYQHHHLEYQKVSLNYKFSFTFNSLVLAYLNYKPMPLLVPLPSTIKCCRRVYINLPFEREWLSEYQLNGQNFSTLYADDDTVFKNTIWWLEHFGIWYVIQSFNSKRILLDNFTS